MNDPGETFTLKGDIGRKKKFCEIKSLNTQKNEAKLNNLVVKH